MSLCCLEYSPNGKQSESGGSPLFVVSLPAMGLTVAVNNSTVVRHAHLLPPERQALLAAASPQQQKLNRGSVYTDYGGQIDKGLPNVVTRAAGDVGMAVGGLAAIS